MVRDAGDRGPRHRPRRPRHLPRAGPAGRLPDRLAEALRRRRARVRAAAGAGGDLARSPSADVEARDDRGADRDLGRRAARSARSASMSAAASPPTAWRSTSTTTCSPSSGSSPAASRAAGSPRWAASSAPSRTSAGFAATLAARYGEVFDREPVETEIGRPGARPRYARPSERATAPRSRDPLPGQAGRHRGRDRGRAPLPARPQAALAEGAGARRAELPPAQGDDRRRATCTPSARRPTAPTSASAGSAARRPS